MTAFAQLIIAFDGATLKISAQIPRQFWIMRIPDYPRNKTRRDAYPLIHCGQSASAARTALATVTSNCFIAALRLNPTPTITQREREVVKLARPLPEPAPIAATPSYASLIVAWDGATVKVEAGSPNGTRRKIEGISFNALHFEMQVELTDQMDRIRAKQRSDLMSTQGQNIQYVASEHDTALANKIWGNGRAESRVQRARLRYSSENAGNVDASGNAKRETANTSPRKAQAPKVNLPPLEY